MTRLPQSLCALILSAAPALADMACDLPNGTEVPVLETAKAQFLASDFDGFLQTMRDGIGPNADALKDPMTRVAAFAARGFSTCQTIVQRVDVGGMVQEVTLFELVGSNQPIALYLAAMPREDGLKIGLMNFNTELSDVLDSLR